MACTQFASTNTTDLSYVLEVDCGTTPDDPDFQLIPTTGGGPTGNISTAVSEVIRSDRMTDDLIVVDSEIAGSVNYELSYGPYSPIIKSLLMDDAPKTLALSSQTWAYVDTTGEVTGTNFTTDFFDGYFVKISSANNSAIDGIYKIVTVDSATVLQLGAGAVGADFSETDIAIEAVIHRNGTASADNYTVLKRVVNGASTSYFSYRGCQISSMSFNFETGSILNGAFDVIGLSEIATDTEADIADGTIEYLDVASYSLMNAVSSITEIDFGGLSASTEFSNMNLTINNNMTPAKAIGTLGAAAISPFTLEVSADSTVYFEDTVIYNKYLDADSFYVDIRLLDGDGNVLIMSIPKAKFAELEAPVDSKDNYMFQNGSITGLRFVDSLDVNESYMVQFAFFPA